MTIILFDNAIVLLSKMVFLTLKILMSNPKKKKINLKKYKRKMYFKDTVKYDVNVTYLNNKIKS